MHERVRLLIYKSRQKPSHLILLTALKSRMTMSKDNQQIYYNLSKGFEGELLFDEHIQNLLCDCLVLNDLLLSINNQTFQIDSLIITNNQIHLFEIKNYTGDFYFDSNRFFKKDGSEISNPLIQLQRTESLLRQLLVKNNFSIPIQSSVIFINPGFTLYNAPSDKQFILPTQLNQLTKKLNLKQSKLNEQLKNLAEILVTLNMTDRHLQYNPTYSYQQLQKGVKCKICETLSISSTRYRSEVICLCCGNKEKLESAVIRTAKEFQILFPDEKITTPKVCDWCDLEISQKTIQRILNKHFTKSGANRWIYYT